VSRSSNAARYGARVEAKARERYGLEPEHDAWHDAIRSTGEPVEIKAAMHRRGDGSPGRFRIFRDYHEQLARADGWYCFGAYRPRGTGVEIVAMTMTRARALRLGTDVWYGAGGHRDSEQVKLRIDRVL